jgi:broad specificity phosphatase PhoE
VLYLIRHGRTRGNHLRLLQGVTDIPLDALGVRQARCVAERLANEGGVDALLCSPLSRTRATAAIIGDRIGLGPVVVPDLIEMDFGIFEGVSFEEMAATQPELAVRLFDLDDYDVTWPNGESRRAFYARVSRTFAAILGDYPSHRVAVVGHGGVFGAFLAMTHGQSPNDLATYDLLNCSLTHLHVAADGTRLHRRNDVGHLAAIDDLAEEAEQCD